MAASTRATARHAVRTTRRRVSTCCTSLGAPMRMVGIQPGLSAGCQYTITGSWLPACGTITMPTPARKRESRVRASCISPHTRCPPYSRRTSPANTLNTLTACGTPGQPPGGGCTTARAGGTGASAGQSRVRGCSWVGWPVTRWAVGGQRWMRPKALATTTAIASNASTIKPTLGQVHGWSRARPGLLRCGFTRP